METIYRRYLSRGTSFEMTLALLQELLTERLRPEFRRIWVNGSNSGRSRLCFTIFHNSGYNMRFIEVGSLRQFRTDGNFDEEVQNIERLILSIGQLNDFIH